MDKYYTVWVWVIGLPFDCEYENLFKAYYRAWNRSRSPVLL